MNCETAPLHGRLCLYAVQILDRVEQLGAITLRTGSFLFIIVSALVSAMSLLLLLDCGLI
jgi:hypothetical protein